MKRTGILVAAVLVIAADVFVLLKASQNRSGSPTSALELTERELRLMRPMPESTALFFELSWRPPLRNFKFEDGPGWFDRAKLEELGYDCRLPLADPSAPAHYGAMRLREAFTVLEVKEATAAGAQEDSLNWSRLQAVDAGRDYGQLRNKHPDARSLIIPSLVRLSYTAKWNPDTQNYAPGAYLRGIVTQLQVEQISVPPAEARVLGALTKTSSEYLQSPEARRRGPRFSAVLYYGRNYEPWIAASRLLEPAQ